MPGFEVTPSSAVNISDKLIELQEGEKGNIVHIASNFYEEIGEHWINDGQNVRRFRCTGDGCLICKVATETGNTDISKRTYYYSPAVSGTYIVVDKKKRIQFESECKILKYGVKLFRQFATIQKDPDYAEDGGLMSRYLKITKIVPGTDKRKTQYNAIPSPKAIKVSVADVDEVVNEIEALAKEPVDLIVVKQMLGLASSEEAEETPVVDDTGPEIEVTDDAEPEVEVAEEAPEAEPEAEPEVEVEAEAGGDDDDDLQIEIEDDEVPPAKEEKPAKGKKPSKPQK